MIVRCNMRLEDVLIKIQEIVYEQISVKLDFDDILIENGIDSVSIIKFIVKIEEFFNVEFELSKLNYKLLRSIRTISKYVYQLLNEEKNDA